MTTFMESLESFCNGIAASSRSQLADHPAKLWFHQGARNHYAKEFALFPHVVHFPGDELGDFLVEVLGDRDFVAEVRHVASDAGADKCQQKAGLTIEIPADESFGTPGSRRYFPSSSGFIAAAGE